MPYTRAIVINPPNPSGYVSNKDSMGGFGQLYPEGAPPFPPLDIPYLLAVLAAAGHEVSVIEAGALGLHTDAVVTQLQSDSQLATALVLVRTSLPTIDVDLAHCAVLRTRLRMGALALFGPAVPSLRSRIERDPSIDFMVLGEPDGPVADLMRGQPMDQVPGLIYRTSDGWRSTPERPFERDLDSIPVPRWDLMPIDRYVIPRSSVSGDERFLPMLSSRGCPFGCNYCPYPIGQGLKWRFRSASNVVDEMEQLVRVHGVGHILFRDPMFSMQQKRVVAICDEVVRRGIQVHWKCETRVDCLDEPTIVAMARAGCVGVNFGVESIDPDVQKGVHRKPITEADFVETVGLLHKHAISTFAFFVVGLPGDTLDTILRSVEFAVRIRAKWTQFTVATPFVGTPMHTWAVSQGFVAPDFYKILNAHTASPGNETLQSSDIELLHRFGKFLQNNLLNRRGILKNERRADPLYGALRRIADVASYGIALGFVRCGSMYFRRTVHAVPPDARRLRVVQPPSAA